MRFTSLMLILVVLVGFMRTAESAVTKWDVIVLIGKLPSKKAVFEKNLSIAAGKTELIKTTIDKKRFELTVFSTDSRPGQVLWNVSVSQKDLGGVGTFSIPQDNNGLYCHFTISPFKLENFWFAVGVSESGNAKTDCSRDSKWKMGFRKLETRGKTIVAEKSEIPALLEIMNLIEKSYQGCISWVPSKSDSDIDSCKCKKKKQIETYHREQVIPALNDLYKKYPHFNEKIIVIKEDGFSMELDLPEAKRLDFPKTCR